MYLTKRRLLRQRAALPLWKLARLARIPERRISEFELGEIRLDHDELGRYATALWTELQSAELPGTLDECYSMLAQFRVARLIRRRPHRFPKANQEERTPQCVEPLQ